MLTQEHSCERAGVIRRALIALVAALALFAALLSAFSSAYAAESTEEGVVVTTVSGAQIAPSTVGADADGNVAVSDDETAATLTNVDFGISDFARQNKGTNKGYNDTYYGYRYSMPSGNAFSAIIADGYMIIYVSPNAERELSVSVNDTKFQSDFLTMLEKLDSAASHGGTVFSTIENLPKYFTDHDEVIVGDYTYRFAVEVEEGYYYATSTLAGSEDGSAGGIYAESGTITLAADTVITEKATGIAAIGEFLAKLDWNPLWVSLRTTGVAILIIFILGLLAAWGTVRVSDKWKGILDTIFTIPMVLPPTVCGFLLLFLFGNSTPTGKFFISIGIDIVFTWPAAVISCVVVGFPLLYRTARGAFESLDANMLDAARTLGWSEGKIFLKLMLPLAWPTIAAGTVLGFARAMGEFGCTMFFAGNYAGITQTIPIAIYFDWMGGKTDVAIFWVVVVIIISFLVILFINVYSTRTQRYKKKLGD